MEPFLIVAAVLVVTFAGGAMFLRRQRRTILRDAGPVALDDSPPGGEGPQLLSRDMLVDRRRVLDTRGWDDTPDAADADDDAWAATASADDDLPAVFDRDYLLRKRKDAPPEQ